MRNILVPLDFSKNAQHALQYAAFIADKAKAGLILFHSFYSAHSSGHITTTAAESGKSTGHTLTIEEMKDFYDQHVSIQGLSVEFIGSQKELRDELPNIVQEMNIDLMVMGTQGSGWLEGKLFGTNTAWAIENINCPLIAIPENDIAYQIKHISYASEYLNSDVAHLKTLEQLASLFGADITVLHVELNHHAEPDHKFEAFKDNLKKEMNATSFIYKSIKASSVEKALEEYIDQHPLDLMAMSAQKRDAYDKVFGKSITRIMVHRLKSPMMFFHH